MASYYAQIDVNITDNSGSSVKTTTPKKPKPLKLPPPKPSDNTEKSEFSSSSTKVVGALLTGMAFANSAVGSYTGNKHTQSNISSTIGILGVGLSLVKNPLLGGIAIASYSVKRITDMAIEQKNSQQQSEYSQSYLGKMTTSGSRWRGGAL